MNESIQPQKKLEQVPYRYSSDESANYSSLGLLNGEVAITLNSLITRYNESLGTNQTLDNLKLSSIIKLANVLGVEIKLKHHAN